MSSAIKLVEFSAEATQSEAEQLGAQITELSSYIYAAEARLLDLIREFDDNKFWAEQGFCSCAQRRKTGFEVSYG